MVTPPRRRLSDAPYRNPGARDIFEMDPMLACEHVRWRTLRRPALPRLSQPSLVHLFPPTSRFLFLSLCWTPIPKRTIMKLRYRRGLECLSCSSHMHDLPHWVFHHS